MDERNTGEQDGAETLSREAERLIEEAQAQPGVREMMDIYMRVGQFARIVETYQEHAHPPQACWVSDSTVLAS